MKNYLSGLILLLCVGCTKRSVSQPVPSQVDLLIRNGWVFDGSLKDSVLSDIGISKDRIVFVGNADAQKITASREIDASGLIVAPGFIDPHTHTEKALSGKSKISRANLPYLSQGITTVVTGNDGYGTINTGTQLAAWGKEGIGTNVALYVGFGSVRKAVLGDKNAQPGPAELDQMKAIIEESMKEGAIGLSTGLSYLPQSFSKTPEVAELAKAAARYGGIYDTHMRTQGTGSIAAIDETLVIGRESGIPLHISHIKASGPAAWGLSKEIVQHIENARMNGINITASQYPYLASGDALKILIPVWAKEDGNSAMLRYFEDPVSLKRIYEAIRSKLTSMGGASAMVMSTSKDASLNGKSIEELANAWKINPEEAVVRVLKTTPSMSVHSFVMSEADVIYFMKQPWVMTGSDGVPGHPRAAGSFTKKIRQYTLDSKVISLPFAIHSSSGLTATTLGIKDRGFIREGYFADIVIFDPLKIRDEATYKEPSRLATGINFVLVNGIIAIDKGKYTGTLAGKALRHEAN